jgi:26S proteasome regulatory subunit N7
MAALYESLGADGVLETDATLLAEMRGRIQEETGKFDEK